MNATELVTTFLESKSGLGTDCMVAIACPCIDKSDVPPTDFAKLTSGFLTLLNRIPFHTYGVPVAEAYNNIVEVCSARGVTHLLVIESDMIVPTVARDVLMMRSRDEGRPFVCGSYTFKDKANLCVAIAEEGGHFKRIPDPYLRRGLVPATAALPMGCAMIDLAAVRHLPRPLFQTTKYARKEDGTLESVTQDAFFTALLRLYGHTPMLDTNLQCVHVSRETGECFGTPEYVSNGRLRKSAVHDLAVSDAFLTKHPPI